MHFNAYALFVGDLTSLSCLESDLGTEQQLELSSWLQQRWHLGQSGRGTVTSLTISSRSAVGVQQQLDCYCCHLISRNTSTDEHSDTAERGDTAPKTSTEKSFVLCLLSSLIGCLDLYHQELDAFSKQIAPKCNLETGQTDSKELLTQWNDCCILYINRAIESLRSTLPQVIHTAMEDRSVDVMGADAALSRDIRRFCESCSLSELHEESLVTLGSDVCTITLRDPEPPLCSHTETSTFSSEFAHALMSRACDDPVALKHIVQEFKMKAIQDVNALKRLLHTAETDHYALYRALEFLRGCGHGSVLLHHCRRSGASSENPTPDTLSAEALEQHIKQTGGFNPLLSVVQ